ncbi:major facilitator superfamily domain-containing protein [Scheffersomyces coipomensis]|uniref:major facilitator superfamily domain-containing protein n=1 Tax=Scheffersomyces coipomensis TaxID=1788519 RepID=UPI00315D9FA7
MSEDEMTSVVTQREIDVNEIVGENDNDKLPNIFLDDPDRFAEGGREAYTVLLGSFLGLTGVLAFVNSAGVVENYIQDVLLPDVQTSTIGWIFSLFNFLGFGLTIISGPVFDKIGCKIPIAIGTVLLTLGLIFASLSTEIYQLILSYGILGGLGISLTFGPFVGVLSHYFLRRRAMAIGCAYIGGAIGGVVFPVMFRALFPKLGWGWTVRIGAFICFTLLTAGWLLVRDRHLEFRDETNTDTISKQILKSIDFRIFKNKVYTSLVLALLGNGFAFLITMTYLPSYASAFGYSASDSYLLLVVFNSLSIPGRVIPSYIADKYGRFNAVCITSTISTLAFFLIWVNRKSGHTLGGLFTFAGIFGFSSGSILSLTPATIGQIFKVEKIGAGIGTAFFVLSFGDLIGIPIGGAITNPKTKESFDNLVIFVSLCSLCGTIGSYTARYLYAGFRLARV